MAFKQSFSKNQHRQGWALSMEWIQHVLVSFQYPRKINKADIITVLLDDWKGSRSA